MNAAPSRPFLSAIAASSPCLLGGLAGYGENIFRQSCLAMGAGGAVVPMVLDKSLIRLAEHFGPVPRPSKRERPSIAQVLGRDPERVARAAAILAEAGHDAVEVNMACPAGKVVRKGRGAALLRDPDQAVAVLKRLVSASAVPVSVKVRSGFDGSGRSKDNVLRILEGARDAGLDAVCVHARTAQQKYQGPADWSVFDQVRDRFPGLFLIGSGDAWTAEDAWRMMGQTGVDAVAVGRGALGNPWFFRRFIALGRGEIATAPTWEEVIAWLSRYGEDLFRTHPPRKALVLLRKTGIKAGRLLPEAKRTRVVLNAARSREEAFHALQGLRDRWMGGIGPRATG